MNLRNTLIGTLALSALLLGGTALAHKGHGEHHGRKGDRFAAQQALSQSSISAADAVAAAEKDSNARAFRLDLDMYRGKAVYEIELFDDKQAYEIRVDAASGGIIARQSELEDSLPARAAIGLAEAIQNAERELGGKVVDAELEDGRADPVYDLKLIKDNGNRIHAEISGTDGKVLQKMEKAPRPGKRGKPAAACRGGQGQDCPRNPNAPTPAKP